MYSDLSAESTYRAMQQLLTLNPGPTAVIAFNDYVALDAMRYARKMNIKVNQDISFVSFANLPLHGESSPCFCRTVSVLPGTNALLKFYSTY